MLWHHGHAVMYIICASNSLVIHLYIFSINSVYRSNIIASYEFLAEPHDISHLVTIVYNIDISSFKKMISMMIKCLTMCTQAIGSIVINCLVFDRKQCFTIQYVKTQESIQQK
jgi:hypothetical protein